MAGSKIIIVDRNDRIINHIGFYDRRPEDIYRVSALWLTNSGGDVLIAQRGFTDPGSPGKWGPAAAGTNDEGESYEVNMYKEADEEIGLTGVKFKLGPKYYMDMDKRRYFCQWYLAQVDSELDKFVLQEEEVANIAWISKTQLISELKQKPEKYIPPAIKWLELFL